MNLKLSKTKVIVLVILLLCLSAYGNAPWHTDVPDHFDCPTIKNRGTINYYRYNRITGSIREYSVLPFLFPVVNSKVVKCKRKN